MKYSVNIKKELLIVSLALVVQSVSAQTINYNQLSGQALSKALNPITTAVPFLMISPDSRAGGMGDAGVATSVDANAIHWNASKLGFAEKKAGVALSYTPWLRALVPDINLLYLSGYYKTKSSGTFAASLRYFSLGEINFTDVNANAIGTFKPNEFAIDVAYAKKLSKTFSIGGAVRFINSNLTQGTFVDGSATRPGRSVAVDISSTYRNEEIELGGKKSTVTFGLNISNIGNKMNYTTNNSSLNTSAFLPINLRLGGSLLLKLDDYNTITFLAEANKLLVPTPPVYERDATGKVIIGANGSPEIAKGKDPNRTIAGGVFGSFNDAPGGGKEELHEINYCGGLEYWYNKLFAVRTGYFYESPTKGARQYITMGAGIKYNVFGLDFAYLMPTSSTNKNPLSNTLRISLSFDFDAFKAQAAATN
jgi:hypothetical protein